MSNTESLLEIAEFLKIIVKNLLNKPKGFEIKVRKTVVDDKVHLFINLYCEDQKDPGILLGSKHHNPRMKDCILKLLNQKAFYFGINKIDLTISDNKVIEIPKEVSNA